MWITSNEWELWKVQIIKTTLSRSSQGNCLSCRWSIKRRIRKLIQMNCDHCCNLNNANETKAHVEFKSILYALVQNGGICVILCIGEFIWTPSLFPEIVIIEWYNGTKFYGFINSRNLLALMRSCTNIFLCMNPVLCGDFNDEFISNACKSGNNQFVESIKWKWKRHFPVWLRFL